MKQSIKIETIIKNKSSLKIEWNDGKKSNYAYLWLRDNCPSDIDPNARERTFNILDVSEKIKPKSYKINNKKQLEVKWNEGNHISYYDQSWLRKNCYSINNNKKYISPYKLWDNSLSKKIQNIIIEYDEIMDSDEGLIKWLEMLNCYGIAIVKNAPKEKRSGLHILKKISHIRETFFGTPFDVINIPKPNNSAYSSRGLRNHTDLPYYEYAPGYQFLHCLINKAKGGESLAVDGFKVAQYLRITDPKSFSILKNVHVKFGNNDYTQETLRIFHSPLINLTKDDDYSDIRFSVSQMRIMDCHPKDMEKFYQAYRKFAKLLHSNKYTLKFRLVSGDIFSFNNRRVLHGRTEFNPNSGHRHLQGYYIDRDEILGRLNFLKKVEL